MDLVITAPSLTSPPSSPSQIELMCLEGELNADSIFIDIGAGLGKPNLHVALDPQVCGLPSLAIIPG